MPIILAVVGLLIAASVWYYRARAARNAAGDILDAANDVRLAARRFGYRRRSNVHPVDTIDDARLAAAGVAAAVAGMDGPLTRQEIDALKLECQAVLKADLSEAEDIAAFGQWIAGQCGTPEEACRRLTRAIRKLAGDETREDLLTLATRVAEADGALDERQTEALRRVGDAYPSARM